MSTCVFAGYFEFPGASGSEAGFVSIAMSNPSIRTFEWVITGSWLHDSSNASYGLSVVEFEVPERSVKTLSSVPRGMGLAS